MTLSGHDRVLQKAWRDDIARAASFVGLVPPGGGGGAAYVLDSEFLSHTVDHNAHHNQVHGILGADHTVVGAAMDVIGLTGANALGLLTPSSNPGAASALLMTNAAGGLQLTGALGIGKAPDWFTALDVEGEARVSRQLHVGPGGGEFIQVDPNDAWDMRFIVAGVEGYRLRHDDRFLGVGTTTPDRRVDILDAANPQLRLTHTDNTVYTDLGTGPGGNFTISPTGDIVLNPAGKDVLPNLNYDTNLGMFSKKYLSLHAAELWVETLVAQNTLATIGGRILVGPTTALTSDRSAQLLSPAAPTVTPLGTAGTTTYSYRITALDADGETLASVAGTTATGNAVLDATNYNQITWPAVLDATNYKVYGRTAGTELYMATVSATSYDDTGTVVPAGALPVSNTTARTIYVKHNQMQNGDIVYLEASGKVEFMQVTAGPTGTGPYSYTVTRNLDGSGSNQWYAGDAVFNTGTTGKGFIDLYSLSGIKSGAGPTIVGNVRNSATYNDWTEHWAIGNLNGLYDYGVDTFGVAVGRYSPTTSWLSADASQGIRIMRGSTQLAQWDATGNILVGQEAAGQSNIKITAGKIALRNNTTEKIVLNADGSSSFEGVVNIGTSGGIYQGTGTFASPTTGLKIWNDGGIGRIGGYNSGTTQWYANTDGMLYWGNNSGRLSSGGMELNTIGNVSSIDWREGFAGSIIASIDADHGLTYNTFALYGQIDKPGDSVAVSLMANGNLPTAMTGVDIYILDGTPSSAYARFIVNETEELKAIPDGVIINHGLNVGTATGAGAGQIKASGNITGDNVSASGWTRQFFANAWVDVGANPSGVALLGGNCYTRVDDSTYRYSNTNGAIGAVGVALNKPWNVLAFISSRTSSSTANASFSPTTEMEIRPLGGQTHFWMPATNANIYTDWPANWAGGIATWDICCSGVYYTVLTQRSNPELKRNVSDFTPSDTIQRVKQLRPISFEWEGTSKTAIGLDVNTLPEELCEHDNDGKRIGYDLTGLVVHLVNAVQELSTRLEMLERRPR